MWQVVPRFGISQKFKCIEFGSKIFLELSRWLSPQTLPLYEDILKQFEFAMTI